MSNSQTSSTRESILTGELPGDLKASGLKGSIFRPNKVNVGIDVSHLSHEVTTFGSGLLESIDKQREVPAPQQHPHLIPQETQNLRMKGAESAPTTGFFSLDHTLINVTTSSLPQEHTRHESLSRGPESKEHTRHGSLSPGPKSKPQLQRKGSLSPGPISTSKKMKWDSRESQSRYQPYSSSGRHYREKKRTSSLPNYLPSDAGMVRANYYEYKQEQWESKKVDFSHSGRLVSSIFSSHPRHSKEIAGLSTNFRIHVNVQEDGDHLAVLLEGHPKGIAKAEAKLSELVNQVQENIVSEVISPLIPCAFVPILTSQQLLSDFEAIEKKNRVDILICNTDGSQLTINSEEFVQPFSMLGSLPKVVDFAKVISPLQSIYTKYKWQAQDDQGEFQQLPGEVEEFLNQCYYSGLPQFSFNGKHYQIDFAEELLCEIDSGLVRKLVKQVLPPVWSYCLGKHLDFFDFDPQESEILENLLRYGGSDVKVVHMQRGTVDFDNMALVNLDSILPAPLIDLQRNPPVSGLPTYGIRLAVKGLKDDIRFATLDLKEKMKEIELTEEKVPLPTVPPEQQHMIRTQMVNNARQYFVELSVEEDNGQVVVIIKGEQMYTQNVHLQLQKDAIELQQHLLSQDRQRVHSHQYFVNALPKRCCYPVEWEQQQKACELKAVLVNSVEWNGVLEEMKKTMSNVKLVKVERVQNRPLWDKYDLEMGHMKDRNGDGGINEKLLFHGTRGTDPKVIVESVKGIDFRYSNQHRNLLWGKGAYFAVNASYSDNYSHHNSSGKQMLLVRVLTGQSYSYGSRNDTSLTKPPPLSQGSHMLYDTVNGYTNGSYVYVVYDHDRAYPAYLITYK